MRDERVEIVVEEDAPRIDTYLARRLDLSRSRIEQLIEAGHVQVNGRVPKKRERPPAGARIVVDLPPAEPSHIPAEPIPLDIVYEDGDLLVLNKPEGMVVHPAPGHRTGTLVNALLHQVEDLSGIGGVLRPGIVHRLDRDTSGLMIVAKNDQAHQRLSLALKRRKVRRGYLAAAWGHLREDEVSVDAPVGRHPGQRKRMAVVEGGRRAVTHFQRIERWRAADLVRAELETGRTHQIRVHLLHIGHAVVGDSTYGPNRERGFSGTDRGWATALAARTNRQFLHAAQLRFVHPRTGASLEFDAPLPEDLMSVAEWARQTSS
ncbi:MAG: RluA family pseudouridine synthase [Gemmatimonadota bacterium]